MSVVISCKRATHPPTATQSECVKWSRRKVESPAQREGATIARDGRCVVISASVAVQQQQQQQKQLNLIQKCLRKISIAIPPSTKSYIQLPANLQQKSRTLNAKYHNGGAAGGGSGGSVGGQPAI